MRRRCYYCQPGRKRTGSDRPCEVCGRTFHAPKWQVETVPNGGRFCSLDCKYQAGRGVEKVKGTRYIRPRDGYVVVKTGIRKWELEHRLVMERVLGRKLTTDEQVHHINGVKSDNDPANLQVLTNAEHQRLHNHPITHKRP